MEKPNDHEESASVEVTEAPEAQPEPAAAETAPPRESSEPPAKRGGALGGLSFLIALAALGASGYLWWQQNNAPAAETAEPVDYAALIDQQVTDRLGRQGNTLKQEVDQTLEALESRVSQARSALESDLSEVQRQNERLRAERQGLESSMADLEEGNRRLLTAFERRLGHLEKSIAALADTRTDTTDQLALSEAEYLLRAANERLGLFRDPEGARRALTLAGQQLASVNDPIYVNVRQEVANHLEALAQLRLPDRVALSTRLLALARSSAEWPLDARRSLNTSGANLLVPEQDEEGYWPRFKSVLSNVVVVHREKETETVLLTLEEERLLRENVRLQLQVAQLAAARGEQELFASSIGAVRDWLNEYYQASEPAIAGALNELDALETVDLNPALPDISGALRQLRAVRTTETLADSVGEPAATDEAAGDPQP
ncbi:MAG: uroporphyrinogen-III C-methyltransferase [Pseudomonadota bacterium]